MILTIDLETSNLEADRGRLLAVGVKPWGQEPIVFRADDYKEFKRDILSDKELLIDAMKVIEQYPILSGQFVRRFDIPYLQARLIKWGLPLLRARPTIDVWAQARFKLALSNNRLGSLMRLAGVEEEKTIVAFDHWVRALRADARGKESMDYIVEHCRIDLVGTEKVTRAFQDLLREREL